MSFPRSELYSISATCKNEVFNTNLSVSIPVDKNGDTTLHRLIRYSQTAERLALKLSMFDSEIDLTAMSQILNNKGESVFDILKARKFKEKDIKQLLQSLKLFNSKSNFKSLNETISAKNVLKTIDKNHLNSELIYNIELACDAVNQTRELFNYSSTHPTLNNKNDKVKEAVRSKVAKCRDSRFTDMAIMADSHKDYFTFKSLVKAYEEDKFGNCDEFAYATAFFSKFAEDGSEYNLNVEICHIPNGDHVFVVIGRDPLSDINDESTWGNQAVVCDAWGLSVFPAYELKNKLSAYKFYKDEFDKVFINMIFSFNPNFHKLEASVSLTPKLDKASLKIKENLKLPKITKMAGNSLFNPRSGIGIVTKKVEKPTYTETSALQNLPKI